VARSVVPEAAHNTRTSLRRMKLTQSTEGKQDIRAVTYQLEWRQLPYTPQHLFQNAHQSSNGAQRWHLQEAVRGPCSITDIAIN
jgi:hypothetical protein